MQNPRCDKCGDEAKVTQALKNTEQKTIKVGAKEVKIG